MDKSTGNQHRWALLITIETKYFNHGNRARLQRTTTAASPRQSYENSDAFYRKLPDNCMKTAALFSYEFNALAISKLTYIFSHQQQDHAKSPPTLIPLSSSRHEYCASNRNT